MTVALRGGIDAGPLRVGGKQSGLSGSPRENTPEKNGRKPPGPFDSGHGGIGIIVETVRAAVRSRAGDTRLHYHLLIWAGGFLESETGFYFKLLTS